RLDRLHPTQEALLERRRVEAGQDAGEGVVGRDAVGQVEVAGEPLPPVAPELVGGGEGVGPGEHATDGAEEDGDQGKPARPLDPLVVEVTEVVVERGRSVTGHGPITWEVLVRSSPRLGEREASQSTESHQLDAGPLDVARTNANTRPGRRARERSSN